MTSPAPECPVCRLRMQEGSVLDVAHNGRLVKTRWTEGIPEKSLLRGLDVSARRQLDTVTFRCPRCGWLIWFAPDTPTSPE